MQARRQLNSIGGGALIASIIAVRIAVRSSCVYYISKDKFGELLGGHCPPVSTGLNVCEILPIHRVRL